MVSGSLTCGWLPSISRTSSGAAATDSTVGHQQQRGRQRDQPAHEGGAAVGVVAFGAGQHRHEDRGERRLQHQRGDQVGQLIGHRERTRQRRAENRGQQHDPDEPGDPADQSRERHAPGPRHHRGVGQFGSRRAPVPAADRGSARRRWRGRAVPPAANRRAVGAASGPAVAAAAPGGRAVAQPAAGHSSVRAVEVAGSGWPRNRCQSRRPVSSDQHRAGRQRDEEQHLAVGVGVHRQPHRLTERQPVGRAQRHVDGDALGEVHLDRDPQRQIPRRQLLLADVGHRHAGRRIDLKAHPDRHRAGRCAAPAAAGCARWPACRTRPG